MGLDLWEFFGRMPGQRDQVLFSPPEAVERNECLEIVGWFALKGTVLLVLFSNKVKTNGKFGLFYSKTGRQ